MKEFKPTIKTKIINIFRTRPKVLLWTLWRSGTHWLADMLSEIMEIPPVYYSNSQVDYQKETIDQLYNFKRNTILIRHICLSPKKLFRHTDPLGFKVIFLYRDPRDAIASNVNMRKFREGYRPGLPLFPDMSINEILKWELKTYKKLYTKDLPKWIQVEHSNFIKLRYEDLLKNGVSSLNKIVQFLHLNIKQNRLEKIVINNKFEKLTGRAQGEEDKKSHTRKGIIGDYKNQFSLEEQKSLDSLLGKTIIIMDYKKKD